MPVVSRGGGRLRQLRCPRGWRTLAVIRYTEPPGLPHLVFSGPLPRFSQRPLRAQMREFGGPCSLCTGSVPSVTQGMCRDPGSEADTGVLVVYGVRATASDRH